MAEKRERIRIENIKDTTANWERTNPILLDGEIGIEVKLNGQLAMKIGDGITHWKELDYVSSLTVKEIETLLSKKVDKIEGMGLSQNNYSNEEKAKLAALGNGVSFKGYLDSVELLPSTATVGDMYFVSGENSTTLCCVYSEKNEWEMFTVFSVDLTDYIQRKDIDSVLSTTSENPVMNKVVALKLETVMNELTTNKSYIVQCETTLGFTKKNLYDWGNAAWLNPSGSITVTKTDTDISVTSKNSWASATYRLPELEIGRKYAFSVLVSDLVKDSAAGTNKVKIRVAYDSSGKTPIQDFNLESDGNYEMTFTPTSGTAYVIFYPNYSGSVLTNSFTASEIMLRYADTTDNTYEPYVGSVDERLDKFTAQSQLYSNTTGGGSPQSVTISGLFTKYSAVICNIKTSGGNYSLTLPLRYIKSLGTESYYEAQTLLFYYIDDNTITIRTGLGQSNPTISGIEVISLY